jgi:hypothetical protein
MFIKVLQYLALAEELISAVLAAIGQVEAGQPVSAPQIKTYVAGKHIGITVTVAPLP